MLSAFFQESHGSFHGLKHGLLGILRTKTELHSAFHHSTYITHHIGYATSRYLHACIHEFVGHYLSLANEGEEFHHPLILLRMSLRFFHKSHAGTILNGNVRHGIDIDACIAHTGSNADKQRIGDTESFLYLFNDLVHEPWFHGKDNHIGSTHRQSIVGGGGKFGIERGETLQSCLGACRDGDLRGKSCLAPSVHKSASHIAGTYDCYLHRGMYEKRFIL